MDDLKGTTTELTLAYVAVSKAELRQYPWNVSVQNTQRIN